MTGRKGTFSVVDDGSGQRPLALVPGANRGTGLEVVRRLVAKDRVVHLGSRHIPRLAAEPAPDGIKVNSVCPGWVATEMGGPGGRPVADGAAP